MRPPGFTAPYLTVLPLAIKIELQQESSTAPYLTAAAKSYSYSDSLPKAGSDLVALRYAAFGNASGLYAPTRWLEP